MPAIPFRTPARALIPALTTDLVTVPAKVPNNMVASLETRVLSMSLSVHPLLTRAGVLNPKPIAVMCMPQPHCLDVHTSHEQLIQMGYQVRTAPYDPNLNLRKTLKQLFPKRAIGQILLLDPGISSAPISQRHLLPFSDPRLSWRKIGDVTACIGSTFRGLRHLSSVVHTPSKVLTLIPSVSCDKYPDMSDFSHGLSMALFTNSRQDSPLKTLAKAFTRTRQMEWLWTVRKPLPFQEWVKRYTKARAEELTRAFEVAVKGLITTRDFVVKNFLKIEVTNRLTDPRNISPRSDVILALLGPYISAIEHAALAASFLIKGLNISARNIKMASLLKYDTYLEIDFHRYDQSLNQVLLRDVQNVILTAPYPKTEHPQFDYVLNETLTTKGISEFGTAYTVDGTRDSGDCHTSIGNGLIARFVVWTCLRHMPLDSWVAFHEGDDVLIGLHRKHLLLALNALEFLNCLGLKVKLEVHYDINMSTFCGRFLSDCAGKLISYCDPLRALSKLHTSVSTGDTKALMLAKAYSYYSMDSTTPVVGPLCYALIMLLRPQVNRRRFERAAAHIIKTMSWNFQMSGSRLDDLWDRDISPPNIPPGLRGHFALRTGMSIGTQEFLENEYLSWIRTGVPAVVPKIPVCWEVSGDYKIVHGRIHELIK